MFNPSKRIPVQTTHLCGCGMIPHNWDIEMAGDARYIVGEPGTNNNFKQVRIEHTEEGALYASAWFNERVL
jgi:hypothetical protein